MSPSSSSRLKHCKAPPGDALTPIRVGHTGEHGRWPVQRQRNTARNTVKTEYRNPAHHMPIWTPALTFNVPGIPHAKQRPRMTRSGKTFTPPSTVAYERSVAIHAKAVAKGRSLAPRGTPVRVDILAQYPRPKRLDKAPSGLLPKFVQQHGDLDNHVKAVLDGINKSGVWGDDCQVQCIRAESVYCATGHRPQSSITISIPTPNTGNTNAILATSASGAPC